MSSNRLGSVAKACSPIVFSEPAFSRYHETSATVSIVALERLYSR